MIVFKRIPTNRNLQKTLACAPSLFRSKNREALVRRIQASDGFSRREAETQINAMASASREFIGPRRTLHLPSFYRTGKSRIVKVPST